jgi:SAM-dependent methyltransferase
MLNDTDIPIANVEMAAAWDGDEGDHWTEHAERYESTATGYWQALLDRVPIAVDANVLDIGCGTGSSTRQLGRIASAGSVLGVDLSSRMLERARASAEGEGLTNVRFERADAQVHRFAEGGFDLATSSFGAMFFADPVAAFTNIAKALGAEGRIALLTWRDLAQNAWLSELRDALAAGRTLGGPPADAPGPFGLARREHVVQVLTDAGFVDVELEELAEPVRFGRDADDAYSFVSTLGITRGLTHDLDESAKAGALDAVRRMLAEHETDEGVLLDGAAWLITARVG